MTKTIPAENSIHFSEFNASFTQNGEIFPWRNSSIYGNTVMPAASGITRPIISDYVNLLLYGWVVHVCGTVFQYQMKLLPK
ncbi:MAG: hypothetical protein KBH11_02105 [Bacteroidia bacterium]|nr:hypothetical protein [Bacteroidota bacterium]MBK9046864.1 hypothetical protein [Bacteroidota bacterium]MBP9081839.1 hypothetical protein [Bacteroidia bacterium]